MWMNHSYVISPPEVMRRSIEKRLAAETTCLGRNYFQRVAMPKAAAMPPMPIRMFQFPRSLMKGM